MLFPCLGKTESSMSAQYLLLHLLGLIITVYLCEKCMFRGRFGKSEALGVAADLETASVVVKMLAWALQEDLGSPRDRGHERLPTRARHLQT